MPTLKQIHLTPSDIKTYANLIAYYALWIKESDEIKNKELSFEKSLAIILSLPYYLQTNTFYILLYNNNEIQNAIQTVFRRWSLEPAHTKRLAMILQNTDVQNDFIKWLNGMNANFPKCEQQVDVKYEEMVEDGRIDIFIQINDMAIIIENKINGAADAQSQLGKYIHDAIHNKGVQKDNIFLVYIPKDSSEPDDASWEYKGTHYKFDFKNRLLILPANDIKSWLNTARENVRDTNIQGLMSVESSFINNENPDIANINFNEDILREFVQESLTEIVSVDEEKEK